MTLVTLQYLISWGQRHKIDISWTAMCDQNEILTIVNMATHFSPTNSFNKREPIEWIFNLIFIFKCDQICDDSCCDFDHTFLSYYPAKVVVTLWWKLNKVRVFKNAIFFCSLKPTSLARFSPRCKYVLTLFYSLNILPLVSKTA